MRFIRLKRMLWGKPGRNTSGTFCSGSTKGAAPTTFAVASAPGNAGRGPMRRRRRKGLPEATFHASGNPDYQTGYENMRFSRMSPKRVEDGGDRAEP